MNLVIVESPAKAKTISKFLGDNFIVESSVGHIRDMTKKNMGIDIGNQFQPQYEISADKKTIVNKLKKLVKKADIIYLATDEDREGESIAWHLVETLNLSMDTPRIVFHEITKTAIIKAISAPKTINQPLVEAQQARRVIDRLVGFEISPILWRKISGAKSAGRVQSGVVRLVVEKERDIQNFKDTSTYKVTANLLTSQDKILPVKLKRNFDKKIDALAFTEDIKVATLNIIDIQIKPVKRNPPAPFMTSTLQQEASTKLGFSVKQTMNIAQNLYRDGYISYMRTDSLNLSEFALECAAKIIGNTYGKDYIFIRHYKTKTSSAQEAHEAIRPTVLDRKQIIGINKQSSMLYDLIRKRTLASQMSPAQLNKTQISISISNRDECFIAQGETLESSGFLTVYDIDQNDHKLLPEVELNENLTLSTLQAKQTFSSPPARYNEASLVKKIEEIGIGRPSTFASIISTVQDRGYVLKDESKGRERKYQIITIKNNQISSENKTEITGADRKKLFPSSVAFILTDFLTKYFDHIIDYQFTANLEKYFDQIAMCNKVWHQVVKEFYDSFHKDVVKAVDIPREDINYSRLIGTHPKTNKPITVRLGRYGAFVQIGDKTNEEKPIFSSLKQGQHLDTITIEEALALLEMPRKVGEMPDGTLIKANYGRFGPYLQYGKKYVSIKNRIPEEIDLKTALELIRTKEDFDATRIIKTFKKSDIKILNGRFGPYIWNGKKRGKGQKNITIKKFFNGKDPKTLTLKECRNAITGKLKQGS